MLVRGLSGLRRDPGAGAIAAQLNGNATPPVAVFSPEVGKRLAYITAFGSYRLTQHHPDGFQIHKRTSAGQGWVLAAIGGRASGIWARQKAALPLVFAIFGKAIRRV